jgi:hypothetical protein
MKVTWKLEDMYITLRGVGPEEQQVLLQDTPQGRRLAQFLAGEEAPRRQDGCFVVDHTPEVDARLCALVDALTAIRWAHPTYTQLALALPGEEKGGAG